LLSLSVDPLGDSPQAVRAWRDRFGAHANWQAAVPRIEDVDRLLDFVRGRAVGADRHTAQVLSVRPPGLPPARFVAKTHTGALQRPWPRFGSDRRLARLRWQLIDADDTQAGLHSHTRLIQSSNENSVIGLVSL
jgi:hypothetical protein